VREARPGDVVLAEVLTENAAYPNLERPDGSLARLQVGDRIVGALGSRQALRGFVGHAPASLEPDQTLALLNMGGVIGRFVDSTTVARRAGARPLPRHPHRRERHREPRSRLAARGAHGRLGPARDPRDRHVHARRQDDDGREARRVRDAGGYRVGAAKLAGVAAVRDLREFEAAGAVDVKSFLDCGLPSTVDAADLAPVFKSVVNAIDGDLVIVELGDGIVGHYRVETVLADPEVRSHVTAVVVCAGDIMAAYGAKIYLDGIGVPVAAFSGLATENVSGSAYIEQWLGVPAINGLKEPERLFAALGFAAERERHESIA
jgi:hypothetical protein